MTQAADPFSQSGYRVRLEWGRDGVRRAAERSDIIVVVDVLRFTTTVTTALARGVLIYPCAWEEDAGEYAGRIGAEAGGKDCRYSLSPLSFQDATAGTRVVLRSPNGATCAKYAEDVPYLFAGALLNARAVGNAVGSLLAMSEVSATVIACGERWQTPCEDGELRFAIEDYLGAGAVISCIAAEKSPEARVCESAFAASRDELLHIIRDCGSGRELVEKGKGADVDHGARLDLYDGVPVLREGHFQRLG